MSKYRIFKCKTRSCYCNGSWIVAQNDRALWIRRTHSEAVAYLQKWLAA